MPPLNPDQLKMFMTPREIRDQYQALDADRYDVTRESGRSSGGKSTGGRWHYKTGGKVYTEVPESDDELWERKSAEARLDPKEYHYQRAGTTPKPSSFDVESVLDRSSYPRHPGTGGTDSWEGHEQSYLERKAEAHYAAHEAEFSGPSIWDSVRREGVRQPVHLGSQFGSLGKPEVVGGHHRIASAYDTRPNQLLPVLHHKDLKEAKKSTAFGEYT